MNITLEQREDNTYAIVTDNLETMQKLVYLTSHVKSQDFAFLGDLEYTHPLHPENCMDALKQVVEDISITESGDINVYCTFEEDSGLDSTDELSIAYRTTASELAKRMQG